MSSAAETAGAAGSNLTAVGLIKTRPVGLRESEDQTGKAELKLKYGGVSGDGSRCAALA